MCTSPDRAMDLTVIAAWQSGPRSSGLWRRGRYPHISHKDGADDRPASWVGPNTARILGQNFLCDRRCMNPALTRDVFDQSAPWPSYDGGIIYELQFRGGYYLHSGLTIGAADHRWEMTTNVHP